MSDLVIQSNKWFHTDRGERELRESSCDLIISVGRQTASRVADMWSGSFNDAVPVSAYPLALWFAANWWRLRWESAPHGAVAPSLDWLQSHDTSSVGYGYIWPRMQFISEGNAIRVEVKSSRQTPAEPFWYLNAFSQSITPNAFEKGVDAFIESVVDRLRAREVAGSELESLWTEVREERAGDSLSLFRRYEAQLGFDPDAGPEGLIQCMQNLANVAGSEAVGEIAAACAGNNAESVFTAVEEMVQEKGVPFQLPSELNDWEDRVDMHPSPTAPWEQGWWLAKYSRSVLKLDHKPLQDAELSDILSMPGNVFQQADGGSDKPLGVALRNNDPARMLAFFKKHSGRFMRPSRRFESARFVADCLLAGGNDLWLPSTDAKTGRQKMQRAFAAEFLCPVEAIREYIAEDFSEEKIGEASDYFGVSPWTIENHLVNTGYLAHDEAPSLTYRA